MTASKFLLVYTLLLGCVHHCLAQQVGAPRQVCPLPSVLTESSGLIIEHDDKFWSHNDSGDGPELWSFDSSGAVVDSIQVTNATNVDWEALASDGADRFFVGDFGNNANGRTDLVVYILDSVGLSDTLNAGTIRFCYPDQTSFPADANFDMEGFFYHFDSLYLFSKNKLFGGNGFTKLYSLPTDSGIYTANLIDSLHIGVVVTGADISPNGHKVALMSYGRVIILENFVGTNFLNGDQRYIIIPLSQTESVGFLNDSILYFTNEEGFLFTMPINTLAQGAPHIARELKLWFQSGNWIFQLPTKEQYTLQLFDGSGRLCLNRRSSNGEVLISSRQLPVGTYTYRVNGSGQSGVIALF